MMKKCLFLLFVCQFMASVVFSQFEWVGDIQFSAYPKKLHKTKSNKYLTFGTVKKYDGYRPYVALNDSLGNLINSKVLYTADIMHFAELPDSDFLIFGIWGCDVISNEFWKLDENLEIDFSFSPPNGSWMNAIVLSNGDIIYSSYQGIIKKVDKYGNEIWEKQGNIGDGDYVLLPGDSFLMTGAFQALYDSSGSLLNTYQYELEKIKIMPQGNFVGSSGDSLYLFSQNFEVLKTVAFQQGAYCKDLNVREDKIVVLTYSNQVFVYDQNLMYLSELQIDTDFSPNQIILETDGVVLSGGTIYGNIPWQQTNQQPVIRKYTFNGITNFSSKDVGVINISQPSEVIYTDESNSLYSLKFKDINVTVKNFGTSVVNRLNLNIDFGDIGLSGFDCLYKYQNDKRHYENLNLAPGTTAELYFGEVTSWHWKTPTISPSENICIWTSSPDQKIETDRTNDKACIQVLTDSKETGLTAPIIKIWPNPAQDFVKLQMEGNHATAQFQILNVQGQVLKTILVENWQSDADLPVWDLPNGMYLWRLVKEGGEIVAGKFAVLR